jgi:hypothetical protein
VGRPIWWYTLSRATNTLALVSLTFALFSGKMMDETWLPKGELHHAWYYAHLGAWVVMGVTVLFHLLLNAKVGGAPFLLSMLSWRFRNQDSPRLWLTHSSRWWFQVQQGAWRGWCQPITALRTAGTGDLGLPGGGLDGAFGHGLAAGMSRMEYGAPR